MAMVPHERSLVEKMNNKPFALIGVDFDNTREECKAAEKEKHITWRSFFDGRSGNIGKEWNIRYLPTIYVLDENGVIRSKGVGGQAMDEAVVDKLVKKAEEAKSKK